MKTKRKEKEKNEEKKRSEEKTVMPGIEIRTFDAQGQSFTTRPRGTHKQDVEMLLLKPSSLIKREFIDIFQKNDCSFNSKTKRKCISFHRIYM